MSSKEDAEKAMIGSHDQDMKIILVSNIKCSVVCSDFLRLGKQKKDRFVNVRTEVHLNWSFSLLPVAVILLFPLLPLALPAANFVPA